MPKSTKKTQQPVKKKSGKPDEAEFFRSIAELIRSARHHLEKQGEYDDGRHLL